MTRFNYRSSVPTGNRSAFTLIELLVVIAIIGILAGLALPALFGAINTAKRGALKLEVDTLADAVEKYRNKFGDYPPDGSNWDIFKRHLQKAFPQILASELAILDPTPGADLKMDYVATSPERNNDLQVDHEGATVTVVMRNYADIRTSGYPNADLSVMDPAEALVFFLGGFSSDPKKPFTGRGGPFALVTIAGKSYYQYNVSRENPLFEFELARLTIENVVAVGAAKTDPPIAVSVDEDHFFGGFAVPTGSELDLLPTYLSGSSDIAVTAPYVYFDSRTYVTQKNNQPYFNFYQRTPINTGFTDELNKFGAVFPLYSDQPNTNRKGLPGIPYVAGNQFLEYQFVEPKKFQVIGPGLDRLYGGRLIADLPDVAAFQKTMFRFPSGESIDAAETFKGFKLTPTAPDALPNPTLGAITSRMVDNVASFSAVTFEAGAP